MRQDNQAALDAAFRLTLDLADITEHQGWRTARSQVLAALAAGPGVVALLGPAGTGKTLLLRELARALREAGRPAELVGRGDRHFDAGTGEVVLIDEAARMGDAALDSLALPGMASVLADLPSLEGRLEERLASLGITGTVMTVVRLAPLRPDEIGAFVADRLARAGQPVGMLTAGAVEALALQSAGVPRVLNLLARAALFMAETDGAARVEERHVSLAVALREGEMPDGDALDKPPGIRVQFSPAPVTTGSREEAEALPPATSVDPVAPAPLEAPKPEPPAPPETPEHPAPPSRPRIRAIRHGAALLAASVLLIASLVAGLSQRPYLADRVRAALTYATASPSPRLQSGVPEPP